MFALSLSTSPGRASTPTLRNSFNPLQNFDDDDDDEEAVVAHLQTIAHSVKVGSKKKSQKQRRAEKAGLRHLPIGMTTDYKHAIKVMANLKAVFPINENDEESAIVDSGSGVHGSNPKKHFKSVAITPSNKKLTCTTADGSEMVGTGGIQRVSFDTIEGHECTVEFDELPVAMPILSVKLLAKRGHHVEFDDELGGGRITNKATGHVMQVIEKDGVYFLKIKRVRPMKPEPAKPFGGPGLSR